MWCRAVNRLSDLTLADWATGLLGDQECPGSSDKTSKVAKQASFHWLFCGSRCHARGPFFSILIWEVVFKDQTPKCYNVIPISLEPLHLLWMKSALHPSSGPPTDASCSCTLGPSCLHSGPFLSEDVATAKLGHRLNLNGAALNGAMLVGWQEVPVSMVLFLLCNQSV